MEVPFTGKSMHPFLQEEDILIVDYYEGEQALEHFKPGEILLHRDQTEFMAHRLLNNFAMKGDWAGQTWSDPVIGKVVGVRRAGRVYYWGHGGHKFKAAMARLSKYTSSRFPVIRYPAKLALHVLSTLAWTFHSNK